MGFIWRAKQGLSKHGILKTHLVSNWGGPVENKEGEKKRKRKRRWRSKDQAPKRYGTWIFGMKTNLDYDFHEIWHVSLGL